MFENKISPCRNFVFTFNPFIISLNCFLMHLQIIRMGTNSECLSVPISQGTNAENVLYRVKRGTTIHVHPDAGLLGREIVLYTNYPLDGKMIS